MSHFVSDWCHFDEERVRFLSFGLKEKNHFWFPGPGLCWLHDTLSFSVRFPLRSIQTRDGDKENVSLKMDPHKRTSQTFIHSLIPPHVQPHIFMYTCWVYVIILSVSSFKLRSAKNIPAFFLNAYNFACYWYFLFHYWEESNWLIFAKSKSTYFYKAPKPQDPSSVLCDSNTPQECFSRLPAELTVAVKGNIFQYFTAAQFSRTDQNSSWQKRNFFFLNPRLRERSFYLY